MAVAAGAALVLAARDVVGAGGDVLPSVVVTDVEKALGDLARVVLERLREVALEPGGSDLRVVGITGSVGKTTTKDLLAQLCGSVGPTIAPVRSFNNEIGLPLTVLRADESTRFLVLEMGASGPGHLDLPHATSRRPTSRSSSIVGHAHLGGFGGIDAVARRQVRDRAGPRRRTGSPCSTPTTRACPRWRRSRPGTS